MHQHDFVVHFGERADGLLAGFVRHVREALENTPLPLRHLDGLHFSVLLKSLLHFFLTRVEGQVQHEEPFVVDGLFRVHFYILNPLL